MNKRSPRDTQHKVRVPSASGIEGMALLLSRAKLTQAQVQTVSTESVLRWFCQYPYVLGENDVQARQFVAGCLNWIAAPLGNPAFAELKHYDIAWLEAHWSASGLSVRTAQAVGEVLCGIFDHAKTRGLVAANVAERYLQRQTAEHETMRAYHPTDGHVRALRNVSGTMERALLELVLRTRPNYGELQSLNWSNINFLEKSVRYRRHSPEIGETADSRTLRVNFRVTEALREWHRQQPPCKFVFAGSDGRRMKRASLEELVKTIQFKAGLRSRFASLHYDFWGQTLDNGLDRYDAPYSLEELGNRAAVDMYRSGASIRAIYTALGISSEALLARFGKLFTAIDLDKV
jgi:hypothetical protein